MKRKKGRILLGTTAVATALTLGGCGAAQSPSTATESGRPAQESTSDAAAGTTEEPAQPDEDTRETDGDFEVFDVNDNYTPVVYGPPPEE